jgi:gamma-glutamylcyclotransferase (GGCT)/AIG2-like uncharacterized protein YtfP
MHDYGCPVMVLEDNGFKIKGELYKITPECMARVTAVECGAGYVPFIIDIAQDENINVHGDDKAIAFIYPSPYMSTNGSSHIKEKSGVKEWNDK